MRPRILGCINARSMQSLDCYCCCSCWTAAHICLLALPNTPLSLSLSLYLSLSLSLFIHLIAVLACAIVPMHMLCTYSNTSVQAPASTSSRRERPMSVYNYFCCVLCVCCVMFFYCRFSRILRVYGMRHSSCVQNPKRVLSSCVFSRSFSLSLTLSGFNSLCLSFSCL